MAARTSSAENFFDRWSRRKLARDAAPDPPVAGTAGDAGDARAFAGFDFSSLDLNSDFTRFMRDDVPDSVRNRGLKMLWASSAIISEPDQLDDYLEDFSEEAMALPAELAKSAYRIGAGFVSKSETAKDAAALISDGQAEAEDDKSPALTVREQTEPAAPSDGDGPAETSVTRDT